MWWSRKALEKSRDIRRKCIPYFTSSLISSTNALSIGYIFPLLSFFVDLPYGSTPTDPLPSNIRA